MSRNKKPISFKVTDEIGERTLIIPPGEVPFSGDPVPGILKVEAMTRTRLRDGENPLWFIRVHWQFQKESDSKDKVSFAEFVQRLHPDKIEVLEPPGTSAEKARPESKKSFKDRFSFARGQVFFDGKDLQLPTGDALDIMKKLVSSFGFVVAYEELDPASVNSATEKLRSVIKKIKKRLEKHEVPCSVSAKRTEGYCLTATKESR